MSVPLTTERLKTQLGIAATDAADDQLLEWVTDAVNAWVEQTPWVADHVAADPDWTWPPDVEQGAAQLGARLYRRRNTPSGIEAFTDNLVYVPRRDGDVDLLLHLSRPVAG